MLKSLVFGLILHCFFRYIHVVNVESFTSEICHVIIIIKNKLVNLGYEWKNNNGGDMLKYNTFE